MLLIIARVDDKETVQELIQIGADLYDTDRLGSTVELSQEHSITKSELSQKKRAVSTSSFPRLSLSPPQSLKIPFIFQPHDTDRESARSVTFVSHPTKPSCTTLLTAAFRQRQVPENSTQSPSLLDAFATLSDLRQSTRACAFRFVGRIATRPFSVASSAVT